jgi:hypothetical protein
MAVEEKADFSEALTKLLSLAREIDDKELERLAHKLYDNFDEVVKIAKEVENKNFYVETEEADLISISEALTKDKVRTWKASLALVYAMKDIASKLGINDTDALHLSNGLLKTIDKLEREIPIEYAKYKAFEEHGWNAHHVTFKDTLYFLVPLVIYILLERR